uniref:hypothetical protein n=1 Tax=Pseudomonas syringae TaxID=317 RepID=UPI0004646A58
QEQEQEQEQEHESLVGFDTKSRSVWKIPNVRLQSGRRFRAAHIRVSSGLQLLQRYGNAKTDGDGQYGYPREQFDVLLKLLLAHIVAEPEQAIHPAMLITCQAV